MKKVSNIYHPPIASRLEGLLNVQNDLKASINQLDAIQASTKSKFTEPVIAQLIKAIDGINRCISVIK